MRGNILQRAWFRILSAFSTVGAGDKGPNTAPPPDPPEAPADPGPVTDQDHSWKSHGGARR